MYTGIFFQRTWIEERDRPCIIFNMGNKLAGTYLCDRECYYVSAAWCTASGIDEEIVFPEEYLYDQSGLVCEHRVNAACDIKRVLPGG